MATPPPGDLTPISGAETDIAPLGRDRPKPPHEQTAAEDGGRAADWETIAAMAEFKELVRAKARFIVPATIFFIVYYLLLLVLVGFAPELMKTEVIGRANLAYVFGISQFFMAWILAGIYVKVAAGWDRRAAAIVAQARRR
jgi:uncharacterized membrane protein (DUF485 family)